MLDTFLNWFSIAIPFLVTVGAVVLALKLPNRRHYRKFLWGSIFLGVLFSGLVWWQQIRSTKQAKTDRSKAILETAEKVAKRIKAEDAPIIRQQNDKIDALQAALDSQGKDVKQIGNSPFINGKSPVKVEVTNPPLASNTSQATPQSTRNGVLTISQNNKISTRTDAPYETEVVIQTTVAFPSLKLAFVCDKDIVNVHDDVRGATFMRREGIVPEHPNVYFYSYGSATPQFDPGNPLVFDIWSKEPIVCSQVQTF
jgi:hypothetical protein